MGNFCNSHVWDLKLYGSQRAGRELVIFILDRKPDIGFENVPAVLSSKRVDQYD